MGFGALKTQVTPSLTFGNGPMFWLLLTDDMVHVLDNKTDMQMTQPWTDL